MECSVVLRPTCTTRHSPVLRLCLSLRIQSRPSPLSAEQMTHEYIGRTRPRKHQGRKRQSSQFGSFSRVHRRGPARVQRGSTYLGEEGGCETSSDRERPRERRHSHNSDVLVRTYTDKDRRCICSILEETLKIWDLSRTSGRTDCTERTSRSSLGRLPAPESSPGPAAGLVPSPHSRLHSISFLHARSCHSLALGESERAGKVSAVPCRAQQASVS